MAFFFFIKSFEIRLRCCVFINNHYKMFLKNIVDYEIKWVCEKNALYYKYLFCHYNYSHRFFKWCSEHTIHILIYWLSDILFSLNQICLKKKNTQLVVNASYYDVQLHNIIAISTTTIKITSRRINTLHAYNNMSGPPIGVWYYYVNGFVRTFTFNFWRVRNN